VAEEVDLGRDRVIVLDSEGWHPGVIGIVASRLVERYHRPVLLIAVSDGLGKGSGRSIDGFNLWAGLRQCSSLLTRFGGHHYAAGFAIPADRIPSLGARINELAAACLTPDDLVRTITLDGEAESSELSLESVSELNRLAPFGRGNPPPLFVIRGLQVGEVKTVGNDSHLAMRLLPRPLLASPTPSVGAIWFRAGHLASRVPVGARVDVCCRPRPDEWNGNLRVRLYVEDMALQES